jgi:energy-coupling factor transport system permease protein
MSIRLAIADAQTRGWLAGADPRTKLAWVAILSVLSVLLDQPASLACLALVGCLPLVGLRLPVRGWLLLIGTMAITVWGTVLTQGMFYAFDPRTPVVTIVPAFEIGSQHFAGLHIYQEGLVFGLIQSLRMLASMASGLALALSTSPERLLAALVWFRVPAGLCFMVMTALRFLPVMIAEAGLARRARRLRGPMRWKLRDDLSLLVPILAAGLRRSATLATSAVTRGFDPRVRRTVYPPLELRPVEIVLLAGLLIGASCVALAKGSYWAAEDQWFHNAALEPLYEFAGRWL